MPNVRGSNRRNLQAGARPAHRGLEMRYKTDDIYAMLDANDRLESVLMFVSNYEDQISSYEALKSILLAYRDAMLARVRVIGK